MEGDGEYGGAEEGEAEGCEAVARGEEVFDQAGGVGWWGAGGGEGGDYVVGPRWWWRDGAAGFEGCEVLMDEEEGFQVAAEVEEGGEVGCCAGFGGGEGGEVVEEGIEAVGDVVRLDSDGLFLGAESAPRGDGEVG